MTLFDGLDAVKVVLVGNHAEHLMDYVEEAKRIITEQEKKIESFGDEALDESPEAYATQGIIVQTVNIFAGDDALEEAKRQIRSITGA